MAHVEETKSPWKFMDHVSFNYDMRSEERKQYDYFKQKS